ncbi:MAG: hypothetical protein S4CHLAM6_11390 [Chlamydiae bacterium]|nr:hypothetical protein [Chlamydiota bacterium]
MQRYYRALLVAVCFFYFSPLMIIRKKIELSNSFFTFLVFWSILGFAALVYFWRLFDLRSKEIWITRLKKEAGHKDIKDYKIQVRHFSQKMRDLVEELNQKNEIEKKLLYKVEQLKGMHQNHEDEYNFLNQDLQNQLDKREIALSDSRLTIKEQREIIEKKQEEINILNMQINDLKYEVENLLKIDEQEQDIFTEEKLDLEPIVEKPHLNLSDQEVSLSDKLQRYIDLAQKMTETNPFAQPKTGHHFPFGTLLIDQRRLFDRFQNEESEVVLVYSIEEERLIFINDQVQNLLGWNSDKFLKDFLFLVQKGHEQWDKALQTLSDNQLQEVRLLMKTRSGQNILTHCYLRKVPQGAFEGHVLGILSSAAKR